MGTELQFPVHRIYCVGRNYADHAKEMGMAPDRQAPFFFSKPADAVVLDGTAIPYALATTNLHHEVELVVAIGKPCVNVAAASALDHVYGYAVGLDLTRRDLQSVAREQGKPWDVSKGFDQSAPVGAIRRASEIGHPARGSIRLELNGETRQHSDLSQMLWSVTDLIVELSKLFVLKPGDLLFTGTPAGVGPLKPGDRLHGSVEGVGSVEVSIAPRLDSRTP